MTRYGQQSVKSSFSGTRPACKTRRIRWHLRSCTMARRKNISAHWDGGSSVLTCQDFREGTSDTGDTGPRTSLRRPRMKRDFDVIIIGSGVAGAMTAYRLAKANARVLLLEAGSRNPSRAQMVGSYATASLPKPLHSPYVQVSSDTNAPSPDSSSAYYDTPADHTPFKSTYERRTGGSTWHWLGHTPRMLRADFEMKTRYGKGKDFPAAMVDWPISYDDLEPWYCEAEAEMGVAGSDEEWNNLFDSPRSKPFPMSMIWPSYSDRWIAGKINGKKFEGVEYLVKSTPSARNSSLYDGRPPCAGNSICVPLCPIGAKYDGYVHVRKALKEGAALWEQCVVTGMKADADGSVHSVLYKTYGGFEGTVTGDIIVV